ncbi:hypothetical protein ACT26D_06090 [Megasphaera elsdenii]|uniref:hypothetical protein n=1 Tax=Megasphaera elsdenii TaxID=907 RepID=UPI004035BA05
MRPYKEQDAPERTLLPSDFSLEKAERILTNYLSHHPRTPDTFKQLVSWLILNGTGYSGAASSMTLCRKLGVKDDDLATWTHWKARKPGE